MNPRATLKRLLPLAPLLAALVIGCSPSDGPGSSASGDGQFSPDEGLAAAADLLADGDVKNGAERVEAVYAAVRTTGIQPEDITVLTKLQLLLLPLERDQIDPMMMVNTTLTIAAIAGSDAARQPLVARVEQGNTHYATLLALGHLAMVLQAAEPTEMYFRLALESHPDGTEALRGLSSLFAQTVRMELALEQIDLAVQADENDAANHMQRGLVLRALKRQDEAMAAWRRAIECGEAKDQARAYVRIGSLLMDNGDHEAALVEFEQAVERDPGNPSTHFNVGQLLHLANRIDEAREHLLTSIELRPGFSHAHFLVGELDEDAGRTEDAEAHYRATLEVDPTHESARYRLSLLLRRTGRADEADAIATGQGG